MQILAILTSPRRNGGTFKLLSKAVDGAKKVSGVKVKVIKLIDYDVKPCRACFNCVRSPEHECSINDDFKLIYDEVKMCKGIILADAVHKFGPTALCHLFFERLYPLTWSGELKFLPFASISCASNQGFQLYALREICKWAFTCGFEYVGGVHAHYSCFEEAGEEAYRLGVKLARKAVEYGERGRVEWSREREVELWKLYSSSLWNPVKFYLENLTSGSFEVKESIPYLALKKEKFRDGEAKKLLINAVDKLSRVLEEIKRGREEAELAKEVVDVSAYWAHATWREYVEKEVVKHGIPKAYKPLD